MKSVTLQSLLLVAAVSAAHAAHAQAPADPRVGLKTGWNDAGEAAKHLVLVGHGAKAQGFFNPAKSGDFAFLNGDLAFSGNYVFQGGFHGLQVWDVSAPSKPVLVATMPCPGGQGDVSIYRNLMFMSVEETRGRVDCGGQGVADTVSAERFRGVRVFDITNIKAPKQLAAVQTCRGSHTHTLVLDPKDAANVYIYVQGTAPVRPGAELVGCSARAPGVDPNTALFRIEVIRVPLAAPQQARVINTPRIFSDSATGAIAGLWPGGTHGEGTQNTAQTDQCHDITVYSAIGLAAGACSGNGILLDISDPANPRRIAEVSDPNFAYWHSATFSNDGGTVLFTDEWGGGVAPRCRASDRPEWGADAIFTLSNGTLRMVGYFKLPVPQTEQENCVAHNGSLIPVPGRDIMAQGWYQGGVSVFDFTDPAHPQEIAFFDRGPIDTTLQLAGSWGAYWYNGHIYSSEIGRGLDVLDLQPSEYLSQNEIDAAKLVAFDVFNPQNQPRLTWPASFVVARAYMDQLPRGDALRRNWAEPVSRELARAERLQGAERRSVLTALATQLERDVQGASDARRVRALAGVVRELANAR